MDGGVHDGLYAEYVVFASFADHVCVVSEMHVYDGAGVFFGDADDTESQHGPGESEYRYPSYASEETIFCGGSTGDTDPAHGGDCAQPGGQVDFDVF